MSFQRQHQAEVHRSDYQGSPDKAKKSRPTVRFQASTNPDEQGDPEEQQQQPRATWTTKPGESFGILTILHNGDSIEVRVPLEQQLDDDRTRDTLDFRTVASVILVAALIWNMM